MRSQFLSLLLISPLLLSVLIPDAEAATNDLNRAVTTSELTAQRL